MEKRQKIHVCMMGSQPSVKGGMSSVVMQLLQHDWAYDIEIRYMATHISGTVMKRCLIFAKSYVQLLFLLIFRGEKIDVLYLHMSYKGSFSRKYMIYKLAHIFKKKVILHLHGSEFQRYYDNADTGRKKRICELLEGSSRVIVLGEYWRRLIQNIAPEASIEVIPNAVAIPDNVTSWNDQSVQLLYLGVLIPRKGVQDLLDAMRILNDKGLISLRNIRLVLGGIGDEMTALQEQCRRLHIEKYVEFAGWVDGETKKRLLRTSQCLILPSYNEGLPVAILEALSYGVPVVSTDVGSIRDAVREGISGHLVSPHVPEEIAAAILDITDRKENWLRYSAQARSLAVQTFDETLFFDRIGAIIRLIVHGGRENDGAAN
ncbi:MAG: glycosyltransferase family 4 protein [Blautia sp.]